MVTKDAISLMQAYARRGMEHWKFVVKDKTKARAVDLLGNHRLALLSPSGIDNAILNIFRSPVGKALFFPMPNKNQDNHIEQCFFAPLRVDDQRMSFDLLLLCGEGNCLGFRFEPRDYEGTHQYGHIQMNRRMHKGNVSVGGLPTWIPNHYPAFPLHASDPVAMFLSMVTSVHGYPGGIDELLKEVMPRPEVQRYFEALQSIA